MIYAVVFDDVYNLDRETLIVKRNVLLKVYKKQNIPGGIRYYFR